MNLIPLTQRLEELNVGVQGKTIFINMIPADATRGVLLRNPLTGTPINYELPGFYRTEFQLIARAGDYQAGEALVEKATAALTLSAGTALGTMRFRHCRPKTHPSAYPLSKGNLLEFACDFDVAFHIEAPEPEPEPPTEPTPEEPELPPEPPAPPEEGVEGGV